MTGEQLRLRNFQYHPDQLLLDKLIRGNGFFEDLPLASKGLGDFITRDGGAQGAASHPVPGIVEAAQNRFQAPGSWEEVLFGNLTVLEDKEGSGRGSVRKLPLDQGSLKSWSPGFYQDPPDFVIYFRPNQCHARNGPIGNPHLASIQEVMVSLLYGPGFHSGR